MIPEIDFLQNGSSGNNANLNKKLAQKLEF